MSVQISATPAVEAHDSKMVYTNGEWHDRPNKLTDPVKGTAATVSGDWPGWTIPKSEWTAKIHPLEPETTRQVDGYFLEHWPFPNDQARKTFVKAGFSRVTCLYFPLAKDDRIHFGCRLLTVLFLVDDLLEEMSFADGEILNNRLIDLSRGDVKPDRTIPVEYIIYDLWESMRAFDRELADEVLEPTFTFMRAQTDRARLTIDELGHYLRYRERDVGKALLSALMRFTMDIHLSASELAQLKPLEQNCSKHISIVNDIYSYEKELLASKTGHSEGAFLCTAVKVLAQETSLDVRATKRVLWAMVREWELVHDQMCRDVRAQMGGDGCREDVLAYMEGLQCQMSGNELWSRTTPRYIDHMEI